jgi:hypothetical protein
MTTAYSGYGIPTPDSTDLNRTALRIRYKHNINLINQVTALYEPSRSQIINQILALYEPFRSQMMFFCGNNPDCISFNSKATLNIAKQVVDKQYAVVGVLEHLVKTKIINI